MTDAPDIASRVGGQLVALLHRRGVLDDEHLGLLQEAGDQLDEHGVERTLIDSFRVAPVDILLALAERAGMPALSLSGYQLREDVLALVPKELLLRNRMLPLARTQATLTLAIADPLNVMAVEEVADLTHLKVTPVAVVESELLELLQGNDAGTQKALDEALKQATDTAVEVAKEAAPEAQVDIDRIMESAEDAPVVRIVNMVLVEAMRRRASDIHIEPFDREIRLRYRVDGVLEEGPAPPKALQSPIISRLKVMADLNIAERRLPQDGRFRIKAQGREVDLRVSVLPTVHGEKVVLRLLDKSNLAKNLDALGLDPESLSRLRHAISQPHGLILVTGPTGSGKTTTLYSALQEINTPDVNIITVENPVEYQIRGINQVEINEATGFSFSLALRSILRQDPDIVLVGETRDVETANIAVNAALTGHLVLTTLHTNDAPGAVARMSYMGVEAFLLSSSLLLAQAQRLVRRICPNCKEPFVFTREYAEHNRIPFAIFEGTEIFKGRGCSRCSFTGYKGRTSIMEVLAFTPELRDLILKSANADAIRHLALEQGFRELRTAGFDRVREGVTTIEEVVRVTTSETA
jgi:type IV pilus assembly protein PilB